MCGVRGGDDDGGVSRTASGVRGDVLRRYGVRGV